MLINLTYKKTGDIAVKLCNSNPTELYRITITDHAYGVNNHQLNLPAHKQAEQLLNLQKSHHWYDFEINVSGRVNFTRRYAGRVETSEHGFTDPLIGA